MLSFGHQIRAKVKITDVFLKGEKEKVKLLGIWVDSRYDFDIHLNHVIKSCTINLSQVSITLDDSEEHKRTIGVFCHSTDQLQFISLLQTTEDPNQDPEDYRRSKPTLQHDRLGDHDQFKDKTV